MKCSTSTYLKNISEYNLYLYNDSNQIITIKKILNITEPFYLIEFEEKLKLIDNNYYIVELVPLNSFYICRLFLDNNLNVIEEYYTVTKENKIIDGLPIYEDLLLSYIKVNGKQKKYHEEILINNKDEYLQKSLEKIMNLNLNISNLVLKIKEVISYNENSN